MNLVTGCPCMMNSHRPFLVRPVCAARELGGALNEQSSRALADAAMRVNSERRPDNDKREDDSGRN
jgi:hypothetical protein